MKNTRGMISSSSLLLDFIIGSSILVTWQFLIAVSKISSSDRSYKDRDYSLGMPIYFGLMNVLSALVAYRFGFEMKMRYLSITLVSLVIVFSVMQIRNVYHFDKEEWNKYYMRVFLRHSLAFFTMYVFNILIIT